MKERGEGEGGADWLPETKFFTKHVLAYLWFLGLSHSPWGQIVLNGIPNSKQDKYQLRIMNALVVHHQKHSPNIEKVRKTIHEDCHQSFQETASAVGIFYGLCQSILTENLNIRQMAAKLVPYLLTQDQKDSFVIENNMAVIPSPMFST